MAIAGLGCHSIIISHNTPTLPIITTTTLPNLQHHHSLFQSKLPTPPTFNLSCYAHTTLSDFELQSPAASAAAAWPEFAQNVSGEWDGFGADFTSQGSPIELPESVVPEAYREWEVKVFDWQTQCPTLAQPHHPPVMTYKTIQLLPTVGCEADAATPYSIHEKVIGGLHNQVSAFTFHSSGSYVALCLTGKQLELEHCLINPQDRESRVRVIQVVGVGVPSTNTNMALENIRVFCEHWYGPFRNGDQLGGCAIRDSVFASTPALKPSRVGGVWQGPSAVASFDASQNDFLQELLDDRMQKSVRDECDLICLPKQLWCSLKGSKDGETTCEVGWLVDHGRAVISRCIFSSDAKLKEISIAHETATSECV